MSCFTEMIMVLKFYAAILPVLLLSLELMTSTNFKALAQTSQGCTSGLDDSDGWQEYKTTYGKMYRDCTDESDRSIN